MPTTDKEVFNLIVKEFIGWLASLEPDERVAAIITIFLAVEPGDADRLGLSENVMDQMTHQSIVYLSSLSCAIASGDADIFKALEAMVQEGLS